MSRRKEDSGIFSEYTAQYSLHIENSVEGMNSDLERMSGGKRGDGTAEEK
jgi:hypothetical protein